MYASSCINTVDLCPVCATPAPREAPDAICFQSNWYINHSHVGGMTVNGIVRVMGDMYVPKGEPLIFISITSQLFVQGNLTIHDDIIVVLNAEDDVLLLPTKNAAYTYVDKMLITTGSSESTNPNTLKIFTHSKRACAKIPALLEGDTFDWEARFRWKNGCNTWWIATLGTLGGIIGLVLLVAYLVIS